MEDSAIGMSGVRALRNVGEETKRDQEDVTILSLNLVDWNAKGTLLNASDAIWTHVRPHVRHKL